MPQLNYKYWTRRIYNHVEIYRRDRDENGEVIDCERVATIPCQTSKERDLLHNKLKNKLKTLHRREKQTLIEILK